MNLEPWFPWPNGLGIGERAQVAVISQGARVPRLSPVTTTLGLVTKHNQFYWKQALWSS